MGVGDVAKRILLGQKLRSSQLGETLLPKRIALPVFASDALSSVAYAPDEVFIMLSLAGASAYVWSWKIGIAIALVMAAVVASYRQTVHAYPSGGGDYEVATVNLGQTAGTDGGERAARRLRAHRGRVDLVGLPVRRFGDRRAQRTRGDRSPRSSSSCSMAMNLRGIRESGTFFAIPTYAFMVAALGHVRFRVAARWPSGELPEVESAELDIGQGAGLRGLADDVRAALPARPCVLVGMCGTDRSGGDLQRRARVPAPEEQERRDHALHARRDRHHDDAQHHRAGQADGPEVRRPARPRPAHDQR